MADPYILQYSGSEVDARLDRPVATDAGGTGQTSVYSSASALVTYDTTKASNHSIYVRYYPYLKMVFVRGYVRFNGATLAENTWATVATVANDISPSSDYPTPFSAFTYSSNDVGARITSQGEMQIRFPEELTVSSNRYVYFSGWWTTN